MKYLVLALLFVASPLHAAITDIGDLLSTTCNSIIGATSLSCVLAAQLDTNNVGLFVFASDNQCDTSNGAPEATNEHTSATIDGNAMTKINERCHELTGGTVDNGVTVSLWLYRATGNLAIGTTIVFNLANSKTSRAAIGREIGVVAGNTLQQTGSTEAEAVLNTQPGVLTIGSLANLEYLFIRPFGVETTSVTFTPSTDYTSFGVSTANTTVDGTSMQARGEFRILTGTGDSTDPEFNGSRDALSFYVALKEAAPATTRPIAPFIFQ
jgi:hypothetical protein